MIKFIKGDKNMLEELQANLFNMISETGHELNGEADAWALKIDTEVFADEQLSLIETALYARIQGGVLPATAYEVDEKMVQNCFSLTADSNEKKEIILNDIIRGSKIAENKRVVLTQPWGPGMYSNQIYVIIAIGLSEDQMKSVELSAKMAKGGMKVTTFAKKAGMVGTASANVANRVGREIALAGTEIGVTVGVGAVKTGVEMVACAANIGIRDLNPKELSKGDNVQTLIGTVKGLWGKKETSKISKGFASL